MSQQEEGEDRVSAEGIVFLSNVYAFLIIKSILYSNNLTESSSCQPLLQESEKLESVNSDLKAQIEELKQQKQQLVYMLNLHRPTCIVRAQNGQTPEDERNLFIQHIKESTLQLQNLTCSTTATTSSSTSTSTVAPLDGGFLSLSHIHCPSHL